MCVNPIRIRNNRKLFDASFDSEYLTVPCNHCYQCVSRKQYDLEIRSVSKFQDLFLHNGSVFNYTLTYNNAHLPTYLGIPVLKRRDMQLFKKRLKKSFGHLGDLIEIQYCGEYGKEKDRPHWHILIYCGFNPTPYHMYDMVKKAWSIYSKYKNIISGEMEYKYTPIGYVGLPCKFLDGHLLPFRSENAVLDNVYAIRYCVKYTFKSYNFFKPLYKRFYELLRNKYNLTHDEVFLFEFPDLDGFNFSKTKSHDIYYVCNYFASCYRNPNNLGMSQLNGLDDDYNFKTIFKDEKNNYIVYPMSQYLKRKMFHISCINPDKTVNDSRYTKYWLNYMLNNINKVVAKQENFYFCNAEIKVNDIYKDLIPNGCVYVKDCLNYISNFTNLTLYDNLLHRFVYSGRSALFNSSVGDALKSVQYRCIFVTSDNNFSDFVISDRMKSCDKILESCYNTIIYESYKQSVQKYNERQSAIAVEFMKLNKGYKPRYIDTLPIEKFINLKSLSIADVKANY